jgi:hypothetical protein
MSYKATAEFKALTAVTLKNTVFWDVTPYSPAEVFIGRI